MNKFNFTRTDWETIRFCVSAVKNKCWEQSGKNVREHMAALEEKLLGICQEFDD